MAGQAAGGVGGEIVHVLWPMSGTQLRPFGYGDSQAVAFNRSELTAGGIPANARKGHKEQALFCDAIAAYYRG